MNLVLTEANQGINLSRPPFKNEGFSGFMIGTSGSGKSHLLAVFMEQFHKNRLPFVGFDPTGDMMSLAQLGSDVIKVGDKNHNEEIRRADFSLDELAKSVPKFTSMILLEGYNIIVDLSARTDSASSKDIATAFLTSLFDQSLYVRESWGLIIDEAHTLAPQTGANKHQLKSRRILRQIASDGRKRGILSLMASQSPPQICKMMVRNCNCYYLGKMTWAADFKHIKDICPYDFRKLKAFRSGEMIQVDGVGERGYGKLQIRPRNTAHLGSTPTFKAREGPRPNKQHQLSLFNEDPNPPIKVMQLKTSPNGKAQPSTVKDVVLEQVQVSANGKTAPS